MHLRGWSLATTYDFQPDLWNTTPPLMIWLMNASMALFGPSELALRLPSMLAALGTIAVVFFFTRRVTHSFGTAVVAVVLLTTRVGFYGEHGARTGDYDVLLCLCTTAYLCLFYFAVHSARPRWRILLAAGACVAAATMTKAIAGVLPGIGVVLYLIATKRLRRPVATPRYLVVLLLALLPAAAFYVLRERLAPGYLEAVWYNDFTGRYAHQLGLDAASPSFFVRALLHDGLFSAGPLTVLAPLALAGTRGQARQALLFALCCVTSQLLIVGASSTRLLQYIHPILPWLAIACAIALKAGVPRYLDFSKGGRPAAAKLIVGSLLLAAATANLVIRTAIMRYDLLPEREVYPQASYAYLFAALHQRGLREVVIVEPGIDVSSLRDYAPQLRYYTLLWRERGLTIDRVQTLPRAWPAVTASCQPAQARILITKAGDTLGVPGCAALLQKPAPDMVLPHRR